MVELFVKTRKLTFQFKQAINVYIDKYNIRHMV